MAPELNQFSFRKTFTVEVRDLLDESILISAAVKTPSDMTRLNVTKGNIKKNL